MSTIWMKISKQLVCLKQTCTEQLWLIGLLCPLIVLATLGVMKYSKSDDAAVFDTESKVLLSQVQLSPAEVAMIIAKPLGELLQMKIYYDPKSSMGEDNALVATLSAEDIVRDEALNALLAYQPRRNRASVITYVSYCNIKKNQAIVGLVQS